MPRLSPEEAKLVKPIVREVYSGLGVRDCIDYVKKTTGITLSRAQLIRMAGQMNIVVSAETRARLAAEGNRKNLSESALYNERMVKLHYHDRGGEYVSELTGKPISWVTGKANSMGITLSPKLKKEMLLNNIKTREKNKEADELFIGDLPEVEQLALYKPWGRYVREPRETFMENWPR